MSKFFLIYCLLIIIPIFLYSQEKDYRIEYLTTNSGLSSNYVTKIISDQSNLKWIATENGISIYNGNRFEIEIIKTKIQKHPADKSGNSKFININLSLNGIKRTILYIFIQKWTILKKS